MFNFFKKAFGTQSDREYKKATDVLSHVNQFANQYKALSDNELHGKTAEFRSNLSTNLDPLRSQLEKKKATLRDFAVRGAQKLTTAKPPAIYNAS